ncbi:uncharacterized protein Z519_08602 [Cladophialophora bantiana CBS 173.52]|uniref:SRPBCC family protein n=1 Tax=Cladophialophora bantiana (strain ATCC 10958 / CBS 173.52 / CDC B-1940 / NIH 8579) TaxID=1442370 RepID=A0A0D2I1N5_CLAB1|nr:uncharacterized protein Z519_08602 [Cladophialophora bantiana CBS 173.52]KIW90819.1 hypothetical protein Z519_08602 [Cladophialophora bantiana CBS 173.52]
MTTQRTKIHEERVVWDFPIEAVWSLVSSFGAIQAWMPSITYCAVDGHGVGATRTVIGLAGEVKETLEVLDDKEHFISYRINDPVPLPAKGGFGSWKLESKGENKTSIAWTADAEEVAVEAIPELQKVYEPFMKDCLAGLKKALS